jgi:hypothetical protein
LTDEIYDRVFRLTLILFSIFLIIFVISLYLSLYYPSSDALIRYRYGYYSVLISGFAVLGGGYRLVVMHRLHEKFKNTGYTWPYPKDVEP